MRRPRQRAWYSTSANPRRKYPHTLEIVGDANGDLIGINSSRANALVVEALASGALSGFPAGARVQREVAIPGERGRFDLLIDDEFVEVKSVTLKLPDAGAFPDAVSARAARHLDALGRLARSGRRATLVFCVQHTGIEKVRSRGRDRSGVRRVAAACRRLRGAGGWNSLPRDAVGDRSCGAIPLDLSMYTGYGR